MAFTSTSNIPTKINLRNEALKFAEEVQKIQILEPEIQPLAGENQTPTLDEFMAGVNLVSEKPNTTINFLNRLRGRLADDSDNTYLKLLNAVVAFASGRLGKPEIYAKFCVLLIGYPDLFNHFERLLFDGTEVNRRQFQNWRIRVRQNYMRELDVLVGLYRSTIKRMVEAPENLTDDQLEFIERECFMKLDDPRLKREKMKGLEKDPRLNHSIVLPCLAEKEKVLSQMYDFVVAYFEQVLSNTLY